MSGVGEASLVLSLISSIIDIFEAAQEIYDAASDAQGLPKKFRAAADQIPLVYHTLGLAEQNISARNVTEEALLSARPVLDRCKESASNLKDIFAKNIPAKDAPKAERLKKAMGLKMKSNKVKENIEEVLKSMELLAQNQIFQDAEALKDIKEAIEHLSNLTDEEKQPQFVSHGPGAIMGNISGGNVKTLSNTGSGTLYSAETQHFGDQGTKSS